MVSFHAHRELFLAEEAHLVVHELLRAFEVVPGVFLEPGHIADHVLLSEG